MTEVRPDPERVADLFDRALDRSKEEREVFLDEACAGDVALKNEVLELLRFDTDRESGIARRLPNPHDLSLTRPEEGLTRKGAAAPELAVTQRADERTRSSHTLRRDKRPSGAPTHIGRFEVTSQIGEGGMGVVYSGIDRTLDRAVALKLVKPERARMGRARMLREAQAMARVAHPNVVPIYEAGIHEEGVFFAMELVHGQTLRSWLDEAPRGWRETLRRFVEAGRGLAAAHRAGVLHRDFKPDNVLIGEDGRARVLDFGLARATISDSFDDSANDSSHKDSVRFSPFASDLTQPGTVMGTPGFMSPEHFEGQLGPWSDQWSFAVALYRALYGSLPFKGETLDELRKNVIAGELVDPPPSDVPLATLHVIQKGMQRYPADRHSSLDAMVDALDEPLRANPELDRSVSRSSRHRIALAVAAVGFVNFLALSIRTNFKYEVGLDDVTRQLFLGIGIMFIGIVAFRRDLAKNTYNRRIVTFFALVLVTLAIHRVYALARGLDVHDALRSEALFVGAIETLAAITIESWFGWPAASFVLYFFVSLLVPRICVPGLGIAIIGSIALGVWFWRAPKLRGSSKGSRSSSARSDRDSPSPT